MQFSYDVSHDLRLEVDVSIFNIEDHRILLYDALFEEPLNTLLGGRGDPGVAALRRRREEVELRRALILDLREDQFEELPESLGLLLALVGSDVVVAAPEGEEEVVRGGYLEILATGLLGVLLRLTESRDIDNLLKGPAPPRRRCAWRSRTGRCRSSTCRTSR